MQEVYHEMLNIVQNINIGIDNNTKLRIYDTIYDLCMSKQNLISLCIMKNNLIYTSLSYLYFKDKNDFLKRFDDSESKYRKAIKFIFFSFMYLEKYTFNKYLNQDIRHLALDTEELLKTHIYRFIVPLARSNEKYRKLLFSLNKKHDIVFKHEFRAMIYVMSSHKLHDDLNEMLKNFLY